LEAALTAFKFLTSKKIQKKYLISGLVVPAIPSIYEDDEVCAIENCDLYHGMQFINRPVTKNENFIEYYHQYVSYMNSYLYNNEEAENVLEKIDNIRKVHYVSIISDVNDDSSIGLIVFIIDLIVIIFILFSLVFLYIEKFENTFTFLTNDLWFISIFGLVVLLSICFTRYGPVTQFKCNLSLILLIFGYSLNMVPLLHKLITIFPEENKYSLWISDNKYTFLSFFLLFDGFLSTTLLVFSKNNVQRVIIKEGESFDKCAMSNSFGTLFSFTLFIYIFFLISSFLLLTFIEWNQIEYIKDIRLIVSILYIDILLVLLQLIVVKVTTSYKSHFLINEGIITMIVISHYALIYGLRIILRENKKIKGSINSCIKEALKMNEDYQDSLKNKNCSPKKNSHSIISKIIEYHYSNSSPSSLSSPSLIGPSIRESQFTLPQLTIQLTTPQLTIPTLINSKSNSTNDFSNTNTE